MRSSGFALGTNTLIFNGVQTWKLAETYHKSGVQRQQHGGNLIEFQKEQTSLDFALLYSWTWPSRWSQARWPWIVRHFNKRIPNTSGIWVFDHLHMCTNANSTSQSDKISPCSIWEIRLDVSLHPTSSRGANIHQPELRVADSGSLDALIVVKTQTHYKIGGLTVI